MKDLIPGQNEHGEETAFYTNTSADTGPADKAVIPSGGGLSRGKVWEVIGGLDKGGILVRTGKELASSPDPTRLSTGALVMQLALGNGRLHYELLVGSGPKTGWVTVKVGDKELVAETDKDPKTLAGKTRPSSKAAGMVRADRKVQPQQTNGVRQSLNIKKILPITPPSGDLRATMQYLTYDGRQPFFYMYQREDGGEQSYGQFEDREVSITDGRADASTLSLDTHGVMLVPHCTSLATYDFYERPDKIWGQYYAEMRRLVQQITGASRVVVFDHNVRNPGVAKWRRGVIGYVPYAHNDYTEKSAPMRVQDIAKPSKGPQDDPTNAKSVLFGDEPAVFEEEVQELLQRRYMIINVWRNISESPIAADPLAVADGRTIKDGDYVPTDLIYKDRAGQTYSVTHDPAHRWLYFSGMRKSEALLFKCFDSRDEAGVVRWTAHTGFNDPRASAEAPTRESIDSRCIAFFADSDVERTRESAAALFPEAFEGSSGPL